jgi:hypothetical protein
MPITFATNPTPSLSFRGNPQARFSATSAIDWDSVLNKPAILDNLDDLTTTGILVQTDASGTVATRTITGTSNQIAVANGDGVATNPVISLAGIKRVVMFPSTGQTSGPWNVFDPYGNAISTTGTTSQGLQEAITAAINGGWGLHVFGQGPRIIGSRSGTTTNGTAIVTGLSSTSDLVAGDYATAATGIPSFTTIASVDSATQVTLSNAATLDGSRTITFTRGAGANLNTHIASSSTIVIPPVEQWTAVFENVNLTFSTSVTGPGIQFDSCMIVDWQWNGGQIVYQPAGPGASSFAVLFKPTNPVPIDGLIAVTASRFYLSNIACPASGGDAVGIIGFDLTNGSVVHNWFGSVELNGTGDGVSANTEYGVVAFNASGGSFQGNIFELANIHKVKTAGVQIGTSATNQTYYRSNVWRIGGIRPFGASVDGINTYGSQEIYHVGEITNEEGTLNRGVVFRSGAAANQVRVGAITGAVTAAVADSGANNKTEVSTVLYLSNLTVGSLYAPSDLLNLTPLAPSVNGTTNSHALMWTGYGYDGSLHSAKWRASVLTQTNAGGSSFVLSQQLDAGATTNRLIISDAGALSVNSVSVASSLTSPVLYGGSAASSSLTLQSTSGNGSSDSILFKVGNNGATIAGTINTSGQWGIGSQSPDARLNVNDNTGTVTPVFTSPIHVVGANASNAGASFDSFGAGTTIGFRRANNTLATKQATTGNIFAFAVYGHDGTNYSASARATFAADAAETFASGAQGTLWRFSTTPIGSTTIAEAMRIHPSGGVSVGGTTDPAIGGVGATAKVHAYTGTAIPAGGTAGAGLLVSSTTNFGVFFGSGAPTLSAAQGSLYLRSDGSSTSTRLYVNTNGTTGWTNVTTAT